VAHRHNVACKGETSKSAILKGKQREHIFGPVAPGTRTASGISNVTIVASSDKHLLNLMKLERVEGAEFLRRFPTIRIMQPYALLERLEKA
jgi:hypothetical protein